MIAKDEQLIFAERPTLWLFSIATAIKIDVALREQRAIDRYPVWADRHRLTGEADDALDIGGVVTAGGPTLRGMEDHHVAPVEACEALGDLIDEHILSGLKRDPHRALLHAEGLGDEGLEKVEGDHGERDGLSDLNQEVALPHVGSIGVCSGTAAQREWAWLTRIGREPYHRATGCPSQSGRRCGP